MNENGRGEVNVNKRESVAVIVRLSGNVSAGGGVGSAGGLSPCERTDLGSNTAIRIDTSITVSFNAKRSSGVGAGESVAIRGRFLSLPV